MGVILRCRQPEIAQPITSRILPKFEIPSSAETFILVVGSSGIKYFTPLCARGVRTSCGPTSGRKYLQHRGLP
ncbi:hypothetical protein AB1N83_009424 [Pleurotus pulmonarius]